MALTKKDLQQIGKVFDERLDGRLIENNKDLENRFDKKLESKFEEKFKPIHKSLKRIEKKLDMTIDHFDRNFNYHHRRLDQLEEKVGVKPPSFIPKVN